MSVTVSQADVLYVAQEIRRDLLTLSAAYPGLVEPNNITDLHDAISTFLLNGAVSAIGFAVIDPSRSNVVLVELRYEIAYTASGNQIEPQSRTIRSLQIPPGAKLAPWVAWSQRMRELTHEQQQQIVAGTGWGVPRSATSAYEDRVMWTATLHLPTHSDADSIAMGASEHGLTPRRAASAIRQTHTSFLAAVVPTAITPTPS